MVIDVTNDFELFFIPMVKLALLSSAHIFRFEEEKMLLVQQMAGSSGEYYVQLKSLRIPVQVELQPTVSLRPSSQVSLPLRSPSPQIGVHLEGEVWSPPEQVQPGRKLLQSRPHPSFPSSQVSLPTTLKSPQRGLHLAKSSNCK